MLKRRKVSYQCFLRKTQDVFSVNVAMATKNIRFYHPQNGAQQRSMPCYKAISTIYNGLAGDKLATLFKNKHEFYVDDSYMYNIKDRKLSKQPF